MKNLIFIAFLIICRVALCADQTISVIPKMTTEEADETILPEGFMVRIVDTEPNGIRVGDGVTVGGISIGDGGWQEGTALSQDLNLNGHSLNLGSGYSLNSFYSWTAISGPGVVTEADGSVYMSIFGTKIFQFSSDVYSLHLDLGYDSPYLTLTVPRGDVQPTIEITTNLLSGTWTAAAVNSITTNETSWIFNISPTNAPAGFFRASVPVEGGSVANFSATIQQGGSPVITELVVNLSGKIFDNGTNLFCIIGTTTNQLTSN